MWVNVLIRCFISELWYNEWKQLYSAHIQGWQIHKIIAHDFELILGYSLELELALLWKALGISPSNWGDIFCLDFCLFAKWTVSKTPQCIWRQNAFIQNVNHLLLVYLSPNVSMFNGSIKQWLRVSPQSIAKNQNVIYLFRVKRKNTRTMC